MPALYILVWRLRERPVSGGLVAIRCVHQAVTDRDDWMDGSAPGAGERFWPRSRCWRSCFRLARVGAGPASYVAYLGTLSGNRPTQLSICRACGLSWASYCVPRPPVPLRGWILRKPVRRARRSSSRCWRPPRNAGPLCRPASSRFSRCSRHGRHRRELGSASTSAGATADPRPDRIGGVRRPIAATSGRIRPLVSTNVGEVAEEHPSRSPWRPTCSRVTPIVAVIIPALNEAGKIGRVLDKLPARRPVRGDRRRRRIHRRHRRRGPRPRRRGRHPPRGARRRRRGDPRRLAGRRRRRERPYLALLSGDDQHDPAELVAALDALLAAGADYVQGSRWMRGRPRRGRDRRPRHRHARSTRSPSAPGRPPRHGCHERLPDLPADDPARPEDRHRPAVARRATTSSRTCCTRRSGAATRSIEVPVHRRLPRQGGLHARCAACSDWWRLFRPGRSCSEPGSSDDRPDRSAPSAAAGSSSPAAPGSSAARSSGGSSTPAPG